MNAEPIWIAGEWRKATTTATFVADDPTTGQQLTRTFPVSTWSDCETALSAAVSAARALRFASPESIAGFLESYADGIEGRASEIVSIAHSETGLAVIPRLRDVEMPRTTTQLRQAAAAAREGTWAQPVIDTKANIRSHFAPIGPVVIFGPNNFPFAFNAVSGGDFAAAIATGCPVIAKSHRLHPGTGQLLAECAAAALAKSGLPLSTVQMLYGISHEDGLRLVSDPRVGASTFTGSRQGGLSLKAAADTAGKPIYLEMSSLNPVILLPGAIQERGLQLATELADSCLAASGQFCTSPNLILALAGEATERLCETLAERLASRPSAPLLSRDGLLRLQEGVQWLAQAGAAIVTGGEPAEGEGWRYKNTLLRIAADGFLKSSKKLQREAFGNATMLVIAADVKQLLEVLSTLEGNLTGTIYSSTSAQDDATYRSVADALRFNVGRLLNNKMPTGVALSPAMNHGGPFPSTSHPGFTAVGIPRSLLRFGALHSYDNVREDRLPPALRDKAPSTDMWRMIDGVAVRG